MEDFENFRDLDVVGNGAYGTVYKALDCSTGQNVALKKIQLSVSDGIPMTTLREISLLKNLDSYSHPHIVKFLDVIHRRTGRENQLELFLVFEFLERDLSDYIEQFNSHTAQIPTHQIQRLSKEMLKGIDFLHSHRIIHRDLKPSNLLISRFGQLKIADFGLAKTYDFEMKLTTIVITLWYRAPEVLLSQDYNSKVDIWSAACIIAEMFFKRPLFPGTSEKSQLGKIFELTGRPKTCDWPNSVPVDLDQFLPNVQKEPKQLIPGRLCDSSNNLLKKMLEFNHRNRPSATECLKDIYFFQELL